MKASKLIQDLVRYMAENGDLEVKLDVACDLELGVDSVTAKTWSVCLSEGCIEIYGEQI